MLIFGKNVKNALAKSNPKFGYQFGLLQFLKKIPTRFQK